MSFLLKIENIAKSSKILISEEPFFSRSKDRSRTHDQKSVILMATLCSKSEVTQKLLNIKSVKVGDLENNYVF